MRWPGIVFIGPRPSIGGGTVVSGGAGAIWEAGVDGEQGYPGPPGSPGPAGAPGPQGLSGLEGPEGPEGVEGQPGPPGATGPAGTSGSAGTPGLAGLAGLEGPEGPEGPEGMRGPPGTNGVAGSQGSPGSTGPQGPPGIPSPWDDSPEEPWPVPVFVPSPSFLRQPTAAATADQAIAAATLTKLTGSVCAPAGFYVGQVFHWVIIGTAAAVGVAANTITVRLGIANATSDAAVATFTTTVGTAAASEFVIEIWLTIRTLGAAATATAKCVVHNSAAAGFINATINVLAGTMATFNSTTAAQFVHVNLTTGASKTATIQQACAEILAPFNPRAE